MGIVALWKIVTYERLRHVRFIHKEDLCIHVVPEVLDRLMARLMKPDNESTQSARPRITAL